MFKDTQRRRRKTTRLVGLYRGDAAKGAQLVDDPMMRMKILDVPAKDCRSRGRRGACGVEDMYAIEPEESRLLTRRSPPMNRSPRRARSPSIPIGFNFEVYYQNEST